MLPKYRTSVVRSFITLARTRSLSASSAMSSRPIPVIVCGRREEIGKVVAAGLQPEYELVHFVLTPEAGVKDLPLVLGGKAPETATSSVGTGNVSAGAQAIILGGGYADSDFEAMHKAVNAANLERQPVWLRNDLTVEAPPPGPAYGKAVVGRVKQLLAKLENDGILDGSSDKTFWY